MRRLGLICGTFNPIHIGHLLIAECARDQFLLDKVMFITSPSPPHRQGEKNLLSGEDRHQMVAAAILDNPFFEPCTVELERSGPSYTIDTIEHFQEQCKGVELALIIGGDNLADLNTWHRAQDILSKCLILVAPRLVLQEKDAELSPASNLHRCVVDSCRPEQLPTSAEQGARIEIIDLPAVSISSSSIRARLRLGKSILYMVPGSVAQILREKRHYQATDP